ncbi:MAG: YggS family pyridoxal phosphate-dependent enzyme [Coprobacillaceae bacterium]
MKVNTEEVKRIIKEIKPATLVAATKYVGINEIEQLDETGVKIFGENKVQSLLEKYDQYHGSGEFHMIGTLQTNKVKYIIDKVTLIHSVDRISLLKEIQKQAKKQEIVMPVLIQVNIAKEDSKHGFMIEEIDSLFASLKLYPNIEVRGLMMMAPNREAKEIETYFEETKILLKHLQTKYNKDMYKELSMGMSNDYLLALKHGATYIRIGSSLFKSDG